MGRASSSLLPPGLAPISVVLTAISLVGPNWGVGVFSVISVLVGAACVWRSGAAPVLFLVFANQWMQASIWIYHANAQGLSLNDLSSRGGDTELATWLTLGGLVAFAGGIRMGLGEQRSLRVDVKVRPSGARWAYLYAKAFILSSAAEAGAYIVPGLSQPMLALAGIKWAFFFMFAVMAFRGVPGIGPLFRIAFLVEFAFSVGGYFSSFKTVFFVTFLAGLVSGIRVGPRVYFGLGGVAVSAVFVGLVWTAVKGEYRAFVAGGEAAQVVSVEYDVRINKLFDLVSEVDSEKLSGAARQMIERLGYVEFFGVTLGYVPQVVAHENGALMIDAIARPFMPRIIFPGKEVIDDSERTNKYTGLGVTGSDMGTSISLGWICEAYIDFGYLGMFPAIFLVGMAYGRIHRRLTRDGDLLGMGMATAVFLPAIYLESSFTKVAGAIIVSLLMVALIMRFVLPATEPWLKVKR